jgi:WD40 repeat protein
MRILLVADQFEELYTLCHEPETRQRFLDELLAAIQSMPGQTPLNYNLVLTLRADFIGQALSYRPFADALQYADLKLGPMNLQELKEVIEEPAKKLHVRIDERLTERILKEISQKPEHLPLLEFALTLLWAKQKGRRLTHAAYTEIGGVEKALADHAEDVYAALNEQQWLQAQHIFVQLVHPGEGTEDTRRLATRADIGDENWELIMRLSSERLVVTRDDETTGEETVEIIHEALIQGWQRLRDWMEERREFRSWQERLRAMLRQWEACEKDKGALLRGALLVEATRWLEQQSGAISPTERAFIEASQQREGEEVGSLRGLLEESERRRKEAEWQRQVALARSLAAQALLFSKNDRYPRLIELSILLAIESLRRFPSAEADQALREGGVLLRRPLASLEHEGRVMAVVFSPDGRLVATASDDKTAGIWEVSSGKRLTSLEHEGKVKAVAFSPDGRLVATIGLFDKTAEIWEVSTGKRLASLEHGASMTAVAFNPHVQLVATASDDGTAVIWEVSTSKRLANLSHKGGVNTVTFSPDGRLVATAGNDSTAVIWEVNSYKHVASLDHANSMTAVVFSPDGRLVATAGRSDKTAEIWEVSTGKRLASLGHERAVGFSPDGRLVATSRDDGTAKIWEVSTEIWEVSTGKRLASMASMEHGDSINAVVFYSDTRLVVFSSDGRLVATASDDKTTSLWKVDSGLQLVRLVHEDSVSDVTFSPDGKYLTITSGNVVGIWLWRPEDLIAEVKSKLPRNLTQEEWKQYIGDEPYRKTSENLP